MDKEISLRNVDEETATKILESTFKRIAEIQNTMAKTQEIHNKLLEDVEGVFPIEVKAWGTSAHIPFYKKYAGRNVRVLLLEEGKG